MKKSVLFLSCMLATAAAFTSCSNDDAENNQPKQNVDGFYMTMSFTGNTGTRTSGTPTEPGSVAESNIQSGVLWLVDPSGATVFTRAISAGDFAEAQPQDGNGRETRPIKVSVNTVTAGTEYTVYFLANKTDVNTYDAATSFTTNDGGASYATANEFVMFNQNDGSVAASRYKVTFGAENTSETTPAEVSEPIRLDRATLRIDNPTSEATAITAGEGTTLKNPAAVTALAYQSYAASNLSNATYMQQTWVANLPSLAGNTYFRNYASYGTETYGQNLTVFGTTATYAFENTQTDADAATSVYLRYKATVTSSGSEDFTDGTFYRYDNKVYTSVADIIADKNTTNPFGDKTAAAVRTEIAGTEAGTCTADQGTLETFRKAYNIEVFQGGNVYYRYAIENAGYNGYTVLRNSIYRINVESISDLGSDVPNGGKRSVLPNYYLKVSVQVNPWVLNTINVQL